MRLNSVQQMNYQETIRFLYDKLPAFQKIGAKAINPKLFNIIKLCDRLGNPQNDFKSIHVAGTNGKGSSSHFLASILYEAGYKTGLYTSPHLKDYRERFRINGKMAPESYVTGFVEQNLDLIDEIKPSFFELSVALAFKYFSDEKVDIAVIEVGLGGRFDSTNIITPILSLITNIGLDHQELLGHTLEKIAFEKAGIIKENIPVVVSEYQDETHMVFKEMAMAKNAPITFAKDRFEITEEHSGEGIALELSIRNKTNGEIKRYNSGLTGSYQKSNILGVITAAEALNGIGLSISGQQLSDGLLHVIKNTSLKGRWQVLGTQPLMICDTGHNEHALKITTRHFQSKESSRCHFVLGFVKDKDVNKVIGLFPADARFYFCTFDSFRALNKDELRRVADENHLKADYFDNVNDAIQNAREHAGPEDFIFIGGSTYLVAEINNL